MYIDNTSSTGLGYNFFYKNPINKFIYRTENKYLLLLVGMNSSPWNLKAWMHYMKKCNTDGSYMNVKIDKESNKENICSQIKYGCYTLRASLFPLPLSIVWLAALVAITGTTILVPDLQVKWMHPLEIWALREKLRF